MDPRPVIRPKRPLSRAATALLAHLKAGRYRHVLMQIASREPTKSLHAILAYERWLELGAP